MTDGPDGYWLAYYTDWSGFCVFAHEIDALRWAVDRSPVSVVRIKWGEDPKVMNL